MDMGVNWSMGNLEVNYRFISKCWGQETLLPLMPELWLAWSWANFVQVITIAGSLWVWQPIRHVFVFTQVCSSTISYMFIVHSDYLTPIPSFTTPNCIKSQWPLVWDMKGSPLDIHLKAMTPLLPESLSSKWLSKEHLCLTVGWSILM